MNKAGLALVLLSSVALAGVLAPAATSAPARITQVGPTSIQVELQAPKRITSPFDKVAASLAGCTVQGQLFHHAELERDFAKFFTLQCKGKEHDVVAYAVDTDGQTGFRPGLPAGSPLTVVFVRSIKPDS